MKFTQLLFVFIFCSLNALYSQAAEIILFETHEDYLNGKGTAYEGKYEFVGGIILWTRPVIRFRNLNALKDKSVYFDIQSKEIWGFKYGDHLFRIYDKYFIPVFVRESGDFIYYENGFAILEILDAGVSLDSKLGDYKTMQFGYTYKAQFVSKSLRSRIYQFTPRMKSVRVLREIPSVRSVYDCIKETEGKRLDRSRKCMKQVLN
ncbi:hypothetical protein N9B82_03435 [Saprospiraceae bacterium]|nr:hypothetical protein [Saprospiraceae bacterium]